MKKISFKKSFLKHLDFLYCPDYSISSVLTIGWNNIATEEDVLRKEVHLLVTDIPQSLLIKCPLLRLDFVRFFFLCITFLCVF